jgi:predicted nucleic acid-binding Zn ribbon protein
VMSAEFVEQPLIVRVHQPTWPQLTRYRLAERTGATVEVRELAAVVVGLMPQLESLLPQPLEPGTEVTGTPLLGLEDLVDRAQRMGDALLLLDRLRSRASSLLPRSVTSTP